MSFAVPKKVKFVGKSDKSDHTNVTSEPPNIPTYDYDIPSWARVPSNRFEIEVIKNGVSLESLVWPKTSSYMIFGRMASCDAILDHASISRFHAIIQYSSGIIFLVANQAN
jgi:hypothetical protein